MNKIKVIDLLNKIANGEEVPKKFEYVISGYEFEYDTNHKRYETYIDEEIFGLGDFIDECNLNDEIEIIDDKPKKIEKLELKIYNTKDLLELQMIVNKDISDIKFILNEIIDYLNEKEDR